MFAIYLIVAMAIVAFTFYHMGRWEKPKNGSTFFDDEFDIMKCGLLCALFWPVLLTIAIVVGPFVGFYRLGLRTKRKKAVDVK